MGCDGYLQAPTYTELAAGCWVAPPETKQFPPHPSIASLLTGPVVTISVRLSCCQCVSSLREVAGASQGWPWGVPVGQQRVPNCGQHWTLLG